MATHSSGLMPLKGSRPVTRRTRSCTAGMREEPPTIRTLEISAAVTPASFMAWRTGSRVAWTRWLVNSLNSARVRVSSMCSGPSRPTAR